MEPPQSKFETEIFTSVANRRQAALRLVMATICWNFASVNSAHADGTDNDAYAAAIDSTNGTSSNSNGYVDAEDGFTIRVPAGWIKGTGMLGDGDSSSQSSSNNRSRFSNASGLQRLVAWVPPDATNSNAAINLAVTVKTPAADYTSLGSFGSASDFGQNIVNMLDRSYLLKGPQWLRRQGDEENVTAAKLLSASESKGRYLFQYTVSKSGSPTRVVYSAVAMGTSPSGKRRFYTVNASCPEDNYEEFGAILQNAVQSFNPPPLRD